MTSPCPGGSGRPFPPPTRSAPSRRWAWAGTGNGELLRLAADRGFDALVTVDRGIAHEQNLNDLPVAVVVMLAVRNRLDELRPLVPKVVDVLSGSLRRRVYHVSAGSS